MNWNSPSVRGLIRSALLEDAAYHDITTQTLIPADLKIEALIRAKASGVVCGLPFGEACFKQLDAKAAFSARVREGAAVKKGQILAMIRGKARAILSGERTALNAIQHMSGIATLTRSQVQNLKSKRTGVYDTRKTLPGWRELQKYAVSCGGGKNHRMSLKDSMLIKDNHLMICRLIKSDWKAAVQRLRQKNPRLSVEMEIQTPEDFNDALGLKPHQVLLDNMPPAKLRSAVNQFRRMLPQVEIEVSGGIRPEQIKGLSRLGVERISMGRLTHSAPAFDCALEITRVFNPR